MSFYQQISKDYDDIFPIPSAAVSFLTKQFSRTDAKTILDAACGSGSFVKAFRSQGYDAYGIDLDEAMVEKARVKTSPEFIKQGDMVKVSELFGEPFDSLICIGNSLVHLMDRDSILNGLRAFYAVLNSGGLLIVQIINYDRILDQHLDGLPEINNPEAGLTFERKYEYSPNSGLIAFNTKLTVPEGIFTNSIPLYPLRASVLKDLAVEAGFRDIEMYGDFKGSSWREDSYATVMVASIYT